MPARVFFAHGVRERAHKPVFTRFGTFVDMALSEKELRLSLQIKTAGDRAGSVQPVLHGVLHLRPYFFQIIENFRTFDPFDVIGNTDSVFFAVCRDFRKRIKVVNFGGIVLSAPDDFDCSPAHAQNAPSVNDVFVR